MNLKRMPKFFSESEFVACSPSCHLSDMSPSFLEKLDLARAYSGVPFVLNSAFRSSEWDKSKGRSGYGYHTLGRAVDVRCTDSFARAEILRSCLKVGLTVGISPTFIHIDDRPLQVAFLY